MRNSVVSEKAGTSRVAQSHAFHERVFVHDFLIFNDKYSNFQCFNLNSKYFKFEFEFELLNLDLKIWSWTFEFKWKNLNLNLKIFFLNLETWIWIWIFKFQMFESF